MTSTRSPSSMTEHGLVFADGQYGSPFPSGFAVLAKFTQYDETISAILVSALANGRSETYSVLRTYHSSAMWKAPYRVASAPAVTGRTKMTARHRLSCMWVNDRTARPTVSNGQAVRVLPATTGRPKPCTRSGRHSCARCSRQHRFYSLHEVCRQTAGTPPLMSLN